MPDENYAKFDEWMMPILEQMLMEQNTQVRGLYFEHLSTCFRTISYIAQSVYTKCKKLKENESNSTLF